MIKEKLSKTACWKKINLAWKLSYYEAAALKHNLAFFRYRLLFKANKYLTGDKNRTHHDKTPDEIMLLGKGSMEKRLAQKCRNEQDYLRTGRDYWSHLNRNMHKLVDDLCNLSPHGERNMSDTQLLGFRFAIAEVPDHAIEALRAEVDHKRTGNRICADMNML